MYKQFNPVRFVLLLSIILALLWVASTSNFVGAEDSTASESATFFNDQPIFTNPSSPYACIRIPAIVKAENGDLLAFAEGRVPNCLDSGNIDIIMRRSTDNGATWGSRTVVADNGIHLAGNPGPLVDTESGRIWLFYNKDDGHAETQIIAGTGVREVMVKYSDDHGVNWSSPQNITASVHKPHEPPTYNFAQDWRWYAITPGHAIQLQRGEYAGRLLIPANHTSGSNRTYTSSHVFWSDDNGATWELGGNAGHGTNEVTAVELNDGRVKMFMRDFGSCSGKFTSVSSNGGATWTRPYCDTQLTSPDVESSVIRYTSTLDGYDKDRILFSHPNHGSSRTNLTVQISYDEGETWAAKRTVHDGNGAYSDLVIQEDGNIGTLYERGNTGGIYYAHFDLEWLTNGADTLRAPGTPSTPTPTSTPGTPTATPTPPPTGAIVVGVNGCTLYDAVEAADSDSAVGGCPAGSGADLIVFDESVDTIYINPELRSDSELTIDGGGRVTLDVDRQTRHLVIDPGGDVTLQNITLQNGRPDGHGGSIYNRATLILINSTLSNNRAYWSSGTAHGGAIFNEAGDSTMTMIGSTLYNNRTEGWGGGIFGYDVLISVTDSVIDNNRADQHGGGVALNNDSRGMFDNTVFSRNRTSGDGGGFMNHDGSVTTITNSTFNNNQATDGGGLVVENSTLTLSDSTIIDNTATTELGYGGGLVNWTKGTSTISNTTFSGNSAIYGGAIMNRDSGTMLTVNDSTIRDNRATGDGGGVYNHRDGDTTINNTGIVENITDGDGGGIFVSSGSATLNSSAIGSNTTTGDQCVGTVTAGTDTTASDNSCHNATVGSLTPTVTPGGPTLTPTPTPTATPMGAMVVGVNGCTLYDAVEAAETDTAVGGCPAGNGADRIVFDGSVTAITLNAALDISTAITFDGGDGVSLSGGNTTRVLIVRAGGDVTFENMTAHNGYTANDGGAIWNEGTLTVHNSTIRNSTAGGWGGGLYNHNGGTATVTDSTISGNSARHGGGSFNDGSGTVMTVTNVVFSDNEADDGDGGGLFNWNGATVTVTDSTFTGNTATGTNNGFGGGFMQRDGSPNATIINSTFTDNTARYGGGIMNARAGSTMTVTGTVIDDNWAVIDGGGFYNHDAAIATISNNTINNNIATDGGGVANTVADADLTIINSDITNNTATSGDGHGGGIWNTATADATIINSTFSGNGAEQGGAVFNHDDGTTLMINDTSITDNMADGDGGGVYVSAGSVTFNSSVIGDNATTGDQCGGAAVTAGADTTASDNSCHNATVGSFPIATPAVPLAVGLDAAGTNQSAPIFLLSIALMFSLLLIVWRKTTN